MLECEAGQELFLWYGAGMRTTPPPSKGRLVQKGSVLVWEVPGTEQVSVETVNRVIEDIRQEREREDRSG
jgi:hypothetical protein